MPSLQWKREGQCTCTDSCTHTLAHTLSHTQTFPWIPRVRKGLNRNLGHAGILNPLSQKQAFTPRPHVTRSTFLALASHRYHTKHTDLHIWSVGTGLSPTNTNHCCAQSTRWLMCTWTPNAILHFTSLISTSSTLVPFKILCRDCFLLFSKGQDTERQNTLWPLCLLCLPLPRELSLFPLLSSTCLPAFCPRATFKSLPGCSQETTNHCTIQR